MSRFIVSERQDRRCLRRSCNQMITGRDLRYGRALAIVHNEEYLNEVCAITAVRTVLRSNKGSVKMLKLLINLFLSKIICLQYY